MDKKIDKKRLLSILGQIDEYYDELKNILPDSFKGYQETHVKRSCERITQLLVEVCIDITNLLIKELKLGLPDEEDNVFEKLAEDNIISEDMAEKLVQMKSFRNILIHRYGEIDNKLAYENISANNKDFLEFKKEILEFLKEQK